MSIGALDLIREFSIVSDMHVFRPTGVVVPQGGTLRVTRRLTSDDRMVCTVSTGTVRKVFLTQAELDYFVRTKVLVPFCSE